jgi:hypothetical protein
MSQAIVSSISAEEFAEVLRRTGYRATVVEQQGRPQVQSAVQGIGFHAAFGNREQGSEARFVDLALQTVIAVQGEVPPGLVEGFNREMRFARLFRQDGFLVLGMDLVLAGGVTDDHLCAQCELWDRIIRDFLLRVRAGSGGQPAQEAS